MGGTAYLVRHPDQVEPAAAQIKNDLTTIDLLKHAEAHGLITMPIVARRLATAS